MKKFKRINPYERLAQDFRDFVISIKNLNTVPMWHWKKDTLVGDLKSTYERVAAADQLGYDTILKATDVGLEVLYRKRAHLPLI